MGSALSIIIDEVQYLSELDMSALIMALHRCNQKSLHVVLFGAGLPQLRAKMGNAKSYVERLLDFPQVDALPVEDARIAIEKPANDEGVKYTPDALAEILRVTACYPYFIQEWGHFAWATARSSPISDPSALQRRIADFPNDRRPDHPFSLVHPARLATCNAMIVRDRPTTLRLLFILRGSILPSIAGRLLAVLTLSALVAAYHHRHPATLGALTPTPFTLVGIALSIFLGFRNSVCYERWWDARRQWGLLLTEIRALLREQAALLPDDPALRVRLGRRLVGFAHALRGQLRGSGDDAAAWLGTAEQAVLDQAHNRPDAILRAQSVELAQLLRQGRLSDILYGRLDDRLHALTTIQAACERLQATPMPFGYTLLLHRTAWLFCLLLPFGLVGTMGYATPLLTTLLAYAFFGLDALGDELEAPFALSDNALPLDALVRSIEIATLEAEGAPKLPDPVRPHRYVLL